MLQHLEWGAPALAAVGCSLPVTSCLLHFNRVLLSVGNSTHLDFEKSLFFLVVTENIKPV